MTPTLPDSLLRLVRAEVRVVELRLPSGAVPRQDLEQFGHVGLLEARQRFDPRGGANFETFARYRIRGAIYDGLREMGFLSRRGYEALRRAIVGDDAVGEPPASPPEGPTPEEDAKVVYSAIMRLATSRLAHHLSADPDPDPEQAVGHKQAIEQLRGAFAQLDDEQRRVLTAVYDLDRKGDSGAAFGRRRGISRSSVSRYHRQALDCLRSALRGPP